jgi:DNA-binding MarR family transcriptional regulator
MPDSPPPETEAASELSHCAFRVLSALDRLFDYLIVRSPAEGFFQDVPLTFSEVRALKALPATGCIAMNQLATFIGVPVSTATRVVDRLVAKGLAVRIRPEYDRRLVLVELSEKARAGHQSAFTRHVGLMQHMLEPLSPAAREQVARALGEIAQSAWSETPDMPAIQANGSTDSSDAGRRS